jgi:hypothetical protein
MLAFNPLMPVLLSKQSSLVLYLACMMTVACSLVYHGHRTAQRGL